MKVLKIPTDFIQSIETLSDAECGRLFNAMLNYAAADKELPLSGNERFIWPQMKVVIDKQKKANKAHMDSLEIANANLKNAYANRKNANANSDFANAKIENASAKERTKENRDNNINNNIISSKGKEDNDPDIVAMFGYNEFLLDTVNDWMTYKRQKNQGYKGMGLKSFLTQVQNRVSEYGEEAVIQVIRDSMAANYMGVVWDWLNKKNKTQYTDTRNSYSFMDVLRREEQNEQNGNSETFSPFTI